MRVHQGFSKGIKHLAKGTEPTSSKSSSKMAIFAHFWHFSATWRSVSLNRNSSTLGILSNHEDANETSVSFVSAQLRNFLR